MFYNKLELKYADIYIRLVPAPFTLKLKWATYTEVAHIKRDNIINKTIKTIDYQMLLVHPQIMVALILGVLQVQLFMQQLMELSLEHILM